MMHNNIPGYDISTVDDFLKMLNDNKIDINKYSEIEFRACDVARSDLPQALANKLNKTIYAADDYYYFSDYSVGVKSTVRFFEGKKNQIILESPIKRSLNKIIKKD